MNSRITLVEPDRISGLAIKTTLAREGWKVRYHWALEPFLRDFDLRRPDAVVVTVNIPGMSGRELIRALRADPKNRKLILVALSERRSSVEAVEIFSAGADEYLSKPVDPDLLTVRLTSLLNRRAQPEEDECLRLGDLELHPHSRQCRIEQKSVRLSRLEFDLLHKFLENPNRVFTRGWLIDELFRGDRRRGVRAVDRHICSLRGKLGKSGEHLQTLVGIGYCFSVRRAAR